MTLDVVYSKRFKAYALIFLLRHGRALFLCFSGSLSLSLSPSKVDCFDWMRKYTKIDENENLYQSADSVSA